MNLQWWLDTAGPWLLTVTWLGIAGLFAYLRFETFSQMSFNEWGDFLAGIFAPLAVFWFIYGYFLQKREIRHQAFETSLLAKYTAEQAQATKMLSKLAVSAQRHEDLKLANSVKPHFVVRLSDYSTHARSYTLTLVNQGLPAENIWCFCKEHVAEFSERRLGLREWGHLVLMVQDPSMLPIPFSMRCRDGLGYIHHMNFSITEYDVSGDRLTVEKREHRIFKVTSEEVLNREGGISYVRRSQELTDPPRAASTFIEGGIEEEDQQREPD